MTNTNFALFASMVIFCLILIFGNEIRNMYFHRKAEFLRKHGWRVDATGDDWELVVVASKDGTVFRAACSRGEPTKPYPIRPLNQAARAQARSEK